LTLSLLQAANEMNNAAVAATIIDPAADLKSQLKDSRQSVVISAKNKSKLIDSQEYNNAI
jgi:hypothetical protein